MTEEAEIYIGYLVFSDMTHSSSEMLSSKL